MLHPSYRELMNRINEENDKEGLPEVNSRYSIVIAASKRARELNSNGMETEDKKVKALSVAVKELYDGKIRMRVCTEEEIEAAEAAAAAEAEASEEPAAEAEQPEAPAAEEA